MSVNYWKMFAMDFAYLLSLTAEKFDFNSLTPPENWSEAEFRDFIKEVMVEARTAILLDESED